MLSIFMSYASADREIVRSVVNDLELLGHDVWFDQELSGGEKWWDGILAKVQHCDLFVFALSPRSLGSYPCRLEYEYAEELGKRILPILISTADTALLPPALSVIQFVDYRKANKQATLALGRALNALPAPSPLPSPLPAPPAPPISPLAELNLRLDAPVLTMDEQAALLFQLKEQMNDPAQRRSARSLLEKLSQRPDLYAAVEREAAQVLRRGGLLQRQRQIDTPPAAANASTTKRLPNWLNNVRRVAGGGTRPDQQVGSGTVSRVPLRMLIAAVLIYGYCFLVFGTLLDMIENGRSLTSAILNLPGTLNVETLRTYSAVLALPLASALWLGMELFRRRKPRWMFGVSWLSLIVLATLWMALSGNVTTADWPMSMLFSASFTMPVLLYLINKWLRLLVMSVCLFIPIVSSNMFSQHPELWLVPLLTAGGVVLIVEPLYNRLWKIGG